MSHVSLLKVAGLHTNSNELSAVPEGALAVADNVVIRAKDVIEPRRGQYGIVELPDFATQVMVYGEDFVFHGDSNNLTRVVSEVATSYSGDYAAPSTEQRMRSLESSGNFYFTTDKGVYKLDSIDGTPSPSGAPKTIDLYAEFFTSVSGPGFLEPEQRVAYRAVFVEKDANNNLLIGSPSGRTFANNSSTTDSKNVSVTVPIPPWVTAGMFVRVYRTSQIDITLDPGDEMSLVKETELNATHISAELYSFTDSQPDDLRGVALYTNNNSGEGILQANEPPPMCNDLTFWNNRTWFANTAQPQRLFLDLLGTGKGASGSTGIRLGDVLTIAGQKFVGCFTGDGESFPTLDYILFPVYTESSSGTTYPTVSQNIEGTTRGLIQKINTEGQGVTSVPLRSYYLSGPSDVPGKLVIEATEPNTAPFSVTIDTYAQQINTLSRTSNVVTVATVSRHGNEVGDTVTLTADTTNANFPLGTKTVTSRIDDYTFTYAETGANASLTAILTNYRSKRLTPNSGLAWNPELPKTDGTSGFTVESEAEIEPQRLYYSKIQQPEAVPLVNWIDVGIKGRKILRIIALRDKLFVFKEDGIYLVSGEAPFSVDLLDNTVRLIAPDSACSVSNQIFGLTNQGVVSVSESGVTVVSRAIESTLIQLLNPDIASLTKVNSFGVSRETDRMYELWMPNLEADTTTAQAFVYNTMLNVWTRGAILNRTCGVVNPYTDTLYMGSPSEQIYAERRSLDSIDYYDEEIANVPCTGLNTTTRVLTIPLGYSAIKAGDIFFDQDNPSARYLVNSTTTDVSGVNLFYSDITESLTVQPDMILVSSAIPCEVEWATQAAGSANDTKQFTETKFLFRKAHFLKAKASFGSDVVPERTEIEFEGNSVDVSTVNWSDYDLPVVKRVMVDSQHQYATFFRPGLKVQEALSFWTLTGVCINFQPGSSVNGQ